MAQRTNSDGEEVGEVREEIRSLLADNHRQSLRSCRVECELRSTEYELSLIEEKLDAVVNERNEVKEKLEREELEEERRKEEAVQEQAELEEKLYEISREKREVEAELKFMREQGRKQLEDKGNNAKKRRCCSI